MTARSISAALQRSLKPGSILKFQNRFLSLPDVPASAALPKRLWLCGL